MSAYVCYFLCSSETPWSHPSLRWFPPVFMCVCVCVYSCAADVSSGLSLRVSVLGGGVSLRCSGLFFPSHFQHLRSVSSFQLMALTHPSSPLGTTWPSSAALSVSHASRPGPTEGVWMAQCEVWAVVTFIFQIAHAAGSKSLSPLYFYLIFVFKFNTIFLIF